MNSKRPTTSVYATARIGHRTEPHAGWRLASLLLLAGCATDNPAWLADRYVITGELQDRTCRISVDGRGVSAKGRAPAADSIAVMSDYAMNVGLGRGQDLVTVFCGDLQLNFVTDSGAAFPPPGRYPVRRDYPPRPGTAGAYLAGPGVGVGPWPFAWWGADLKGYGGEVVLDRISGVEGVASQGGVVGRFRLLARRSAGGP